MGLAVPDAVEDEFRYEVVHGSGTQGVVCQSCSSLRVDEEVDVHGS
jgi:hypothetical protein